MKYLYIPTSSLNFNNILSTGSISPPVVYAARRFGYNKFEVVPPNPFHNILLLYDRYPVFSITDADRDNHPLVLRILADRISLDLSANRVINVYDKTIYIDPASTEFLFSTQDAIRITLTKAEPSLTTKLVCLYRLGINVACPSSCDSFNWSPNMLDSYCDGPNEVALRNCEPDLRINRLKGFATGYILGAYKSLDEKIAKFISVNKEQRNEISALLNDSSRGNQERLRRALEACANLDELWLTEGAGRQRFEPEQGDRIVNNRGRIVAIEYHHESDIQSSLLMVKLFNDYCLSSGFTGQIDESIFDLAMDGAKAIKNLMGNEWGNSPTRTYINDLLNNIKSGSPFDFNSSRSLALRSFAAFVQKGDDLVKLETFLVDQGVGDFRIAFALWGAMFGFSKIPKTVYNLPEIHGDLQYLKKVHNYVHSVVHGIPLADLEEKNTRPKQQIVSIGTPVCGQLLEVIEKFKEKFPDCSSLVPVLTSLLVECGGICKDFIEKLGKEKFPRKKNIPTKKDVVSFFKDALKSQPDSSEQLPLLAVEQKTLKLWDDPHAWEVVLDAVPHNFQVKIREDLTWYQERLKDPDNNHFKPFNERSNGYAIGSFNKFLKKNRSYLGDDVIKAIVNLLSNRYR